MAIRTYTKDQAGELVRGWRTVEELWLSSRITESIKVDDHLIDLLKQFEAHFGAPVEFETANSLYRTAATNKACGGSKGSKHMQGIAADFHIPGVTPLELAQYAEQLGAGGIGVYSGWGTHGKHIHLDTRAGRARWWKKTSGSNTPGFGGVPVSFKSGHRSPAIYLIQKELTAKGFACGSLDGCFGAKTAVALKRYQAAHGLEADGIFGKNTNAAMGLFEW